MAEQAINVIFEIKGPDSLLVEVKTDDGKSIKISNWIERKDGL